MSAGSTTSSARSAGGRRGSGLRRRRVVGRHAHGLGGGPGLRHVHLLANDGAAGPAGDIRRGRRSRRAAARQRASRPNQRGRSMAAEDGDRPRGPAQADRVAWSASRSDGWWFHLRRCAQCGHVGCCDSVAVAAREAARRDSRPSRSPQSFEPGEDWFWNYAARGVRRKARSWRRPTSIRSTSQSPDQPAVCRATGSRDSTDPIMEAGRRLWLRIHRAPGAFRRSARGNRGLEHRRCRPGEVRAAASWRPILKNAHRGGVDGARANGFDAGGRNSPYVARRRRRGWAERRPTGTRRARDTCRQ